MNTMVSVGSVAVTAMAAALSLSSCSDNAQTQSSLAQQPSVTRQFAGREFTVPSGWTTEEAAGGLLLLAPRPEAGWQANVFLEVRVDRERRSLEQGLADLAPNLRARKSQFTELSRKTGKLPSGLDYALLEYSCTQQGTALRQWDVVVELADSKRLIILASSAESRWDKYQPLFRSFLDSVH
jgi:DcrB